MNPNHNGITSDINISAKNITNCTGVIEILRKSGIMSTVSQTTSIICDNSRCWTENSCAIKLTGLNHNEIEENVWIPLRDKYNLDCAHLHIHGYYIGCIKNFIRPSSCPTKK